MSIPIVVNKGSNSNYEALKYLEGILDKKSVDDRYHIIKVVNEIGTTAASYEIRRAPLKGIEDGLYTINRTGMVCILTPYTGPSTPLDADKVIDGIVGSNWERQEYEFEAVKYSRHKSSAFWGEFCKLVKFTGCSLRAEPCQELPLGTYEVHTCKIGVLLKSNTSMLVIASLRD